MNLEKEQKILGKLHRSAAYMKQQDQRTPQASYKITDVEETLEYMWLKPQFTGLNVDIMVDDGGSYKLHDHRLLLLVRNGYTRDCNEWIPINVMNTPYIMDADIAVKISSQEICKVYDFIERNVESLISLADRKITQEEFIESIRKV